MTERKVKLRDRKQSEEDEPKLPDEVISEGSSNEVDLVASDNKQVAASIVQIGTDEDASDIEANAEPNDRGAWGKKIEFILSCVAFAVGLGNVWRFPYLCYKNGGGAFLIPYVVMLVTLGLPIFFLEFAFGQFASKGPISIWSISPLFKGVGYAMATVSWYISLYYNVIIATAFFYLFASFQSPLPWSSCNNYWNTKDCRVIGENLTGLVNVTSPGAEYYNNYVLQKSDSFEDFGTPVWHLTLCLLFAWIVVVLALIKGVQSLGKVSYFTATFPYIMLTVLMVRAATLPGSLEGVRYYVTPDFNRLKDYKAWTDAATQIIFSLSCCNGGLISMSSYNHFKNNCYRDAVIVAVVNCLTSVFAGFVVFSTLGFMAHAKNLTVPDVVEAGPGLVFMVYPEALNQMPGATFWSILFFVMLATLGLGSQLPYVETLLSSFQDEFRQRNWLTTDSSKFYFRACLCSFNFLITLPMVCNGGTYLVNLVDSVMSGYPVLIIALLELVVITYVYGILQFMRDVRLMIEKKPNWYWRICWTVISPLMVVALIIFMIVGSKPFEFNGYKYPFGIQVLGQLIAIVPIVEIVLCFLYRYCKEGGIYVWSESKKPDISWGPAGEDNRAEFWRDVWENRTGKKLADSQRGDEDVEAGEACGSSTNVTLAAIAAISGSNLTMHKASSCQALQNVITDTDFFKSNWGVAEKLTQRQAKKLEKQGIPANLLASTDRLQTVACSMDDLRTLQELAVRRNAEAADNREEDDSSNIVETNQKGRISNVMRRLRRKNSEPSADQE